MCNLRVSLLCLRHMLIKIFVLVPLSTTFVKLEESLEKELAFSEVFYDSSWRVSRFL
jgi:hypothetical protein